MAKKDPKATAKNRKVVSSVQKDGILTLTFDENGKAVSAKMKPISDVTDFSFDFGDLDLKKVE